MKLLVHTVALATSLVAASAQASDTVLASASAALSNLQITVIDLDPNDGLAASVTFSPAALLTYYQQGGEINPVESQMLVDLNALSSNPLTGTLAVGTYSFASAGIGLASSVNSSELLPGRQDPGNWANQTSGFRKEMAFGTIIDVDSPFLHAITPLVLGANTAVVISGDAMVSTSTAAKPPSDVVSLFDPAQVDLSKLGLYSSAMSTLDISLTEPGGGWSPESSVSVISRSESGVSYDDDWAVTPFSVTIGNSSLETHDQDFSLTLTTSAAAYVSARLLPTTPAIPEPSTYALMGLGLVGIALARGRTDSKA